MFNIPSEFTQGDSVSWIESNIGFELSSTLACFIRGASPMVTSSLDLTGIVNASMWCFTISTNQSQGLVAGVYRAQFVLFNGTNNRVTLGNQNVLVLPSLEFTTNYDGRNSDEIELEKIESAIASMMSNGGVAEYYIGDRRVRYFNLEELYKERDRLRRRVAMRKNRGAIGGLNISGEFR